MENLISTIYTNRELETLTVGADEAGEAVVIDAQIAAMEDTEFGREIMETYHLMADCYQYAM